MRKIAVILIAGLIIAWLGPVCAGEFSLNGSYRLTATDTDTGVTGTNADESSNFQQRFRLPFSWKVNDNIIAFMSTDWTEQQTGGANDFWGGGSALGASDAMQIDYAWIKIAQPMFDLTVGAQEVLLGNWSAFDSDQEGFTLDLNFKPLIITLAYGKLSEDSSKRDDGNNADADSYGAQIKYSGEGFNIGVLYASALDREPAVNDEKIGYGLFADAAFGPWSLKGELDIFDGEAAANVKYEGVNLWADISYQVSDALLLGIAGYYAEGNDSAAKDQLSNVSNTGFSFHIFDYDFNSALMIDEFPQLSADDFEMATDSGIQAIKGYVRYKATDVLTVYAMLAHATPEQNITLDSKTYVVGSLDYTWIPNVTVALGVAYIVPDYSDATHDDPCVQYVAGLSVNF